MYTYNIKRINRVIDGDTVDVTIDLGFKIYVDLRVRLHQINCPETRTTDINQKQKGLAAKQFLEQLLQDAQSVTLISHKIGKFGRVIGSLYINENCVNDLMVTEGHAVYIS